MDELEHCLEESCTGCRSILLRVYRELRAAGYDDPKAFESAVRVLELRHPGHGREHYRGLTAQWIAAEAEN